jgi:hypothetical protein
MGIDNDEIYQIIVTKIQKNKHFYFFPCNGKGIEALINTIENKEPRISFLYKSIRHLWMGFYAGDETAGILINSSVYTRSSIAVEDKKNQNYPAVLGYN